MCMSGWYNIVRNIMCQYNIVWYDNVNVFLITYGGGGGGGGGYEFKQDLQTIIRPEKELPEITHPMYWH